MPDPTYGQKGMRGGTRERKQYHSFLARVGLGPNPFVASLLPLHQGGALAQPKSKISDTVV
jgi:hypothetical protein